MTRDEFFEFIHARLGKSECRRFDRTDFSDVRRAAPTNLRKDEVVSLCKQLREWHWRMMGYRLLFKLVLEDTISAFIELIGWESNENCVAYLMQVMEVRATKSNSAKLYSAIRETLVKQPPSTQRSLLLAKLARHLAEDSLVTLIVQDIRSGSCRAGALRQYRKLKDPRIEALLVELG
jgi:hypothetical protein